MKINFLVLSDLHLGHRTNDTKYLINNLDLFFKKYEKDILKSDIIFISGDIFDRLLSSSSPELRLIFNWLARLAQYCKNNNIKFRILEGTPSHDWKQIKAFNEVLTTLDLKGLDYKYFDDIEIEHMSDYDINILYIPDEIRTTSKEVIEDVKKLYKDKNIDKVDLIIMHGAFKYQIPQIVSEKFYDEEEIQNLSEGPIISGHIHRPSTYKKIIVPGSFDRLTFEDELDTKSGLFVTYDTKNKTFDYKRLENKNALYFKTIDLTKIDYNTLKEKLDKISKNHNRAIIRFLVTDNKIIYNLDELSLSYPNLTFKVKDIGKKEVTIEETKNNELETIIINQNTIKDLLIEELKNRNIEVTEKYIEEIDNHIS